MTLRRKMSLQIIAMIVGLLLLGAASLWGLNGLRQDYGLALDGYRQLRGLFEIGAQLTTAKTLLDLDGPARAEAHEALRAAASKLEIHRSAAWRDPDATNADAIAGDLSKALASGGAAGDERRAVNAALAQIGRSAAALRDRIEASQAAAERKRHATMAAIAAVASVVVVGASALGVRQHRGVMGPLNRLGAAVRRIAEGDLSARAPNDAKPVATDEFTALSGDFNLMADRLSALCQDLERQVAEKSRELVRSERLASVGCLAAGVAHEINNPLGVIAGYAELSISRIDGGGGVSVNDLKGTLQIVCDEAFRCKEITDKLLSLVRPGEGVRTPVRLADVAREVAVFVGGLSKFREHELHVVADEAERSVVWAVEAEMKQVLMNLTINAFEALPPRGGSVRVIVQRKGEWVSLAVEDSGRGMSAQTLERVFEPFYTEKRGSPHPGTGLGLSITHAIVQQHGGRIVAHSDGPGAGSRFEIDMPAHDNHGVEVTT